MDKKITLFFTEDFDPPYEICWGEDDEGFSLVECTKEFSTLEDALTPLKELFNDVW